MFSSYSIPLMPKFIESVEGTEPYAAEDEIGRLHCPGGKYLLVALVEECFQCIGHDGETEVRGMVLELPAVYLNPHFAPS